MKMGPKWVGLAFCWLPASALMAQDANELKKAEEAADAPLPQDEQAYFTSLTWRNIGPDRGGRSISATGTASRPNEYYFTAVGGGLWKTSDGGQSWKPVTDGQLDTASVGGVAVCEANPDILYLTTGETQLRGNILPGNGGWKSVDAGKTWAKTGLADVQNFARVRIDPANCDTAFVAGFGHYGEANAERGVFKTTDGGKSWRKVLFRDAKTGAVDISIDPKNPRNIYAALWEAWRKPWGMSSGGPGSGLFHSTDGGETWKELTRAPGLPQQGLIGKIGVSVSPVDANRVYAIIEHAEEGGLFVSDDAGASWRRSNDSRDLRQRAFYYSRLLADPVEKDRVYILNVDFFRSDDAGATLKKIKVPHGDNHDLWIDPVNNQRMIQANDGGANVSVNGGESWTRQNYPTAQMYRVSVSNHFPYFVCGGQQDNSTICVPSRDWKHVNVLGGQYGFAAGGGESGYVTNDPLNPEIFYAGSYGGTLDRYDRATGQARAINVLPDNPMGYSAGEIAERFQWTFPIVFDPHDPKSLYVTSQHVWRSRNEGQSWEKISPDLTLADPKTLGPSGGPITRDQTGVETYATVFALAPSRRERGLIWAGSDDGLVHVTRDGGGNWANVTPKALPQYVKITTVEDSPHSDGTAYLTGHRFLLNDFKPYVLKTTDYGRTWTSIASGLPADEMARSIREDPVRPGLLYLGTERGVWVSFNGGKDWRKLQRNLPAVQVSDLAVTANDLVIATHGRSFWVLDNIGVLRQLESGAPRTERLFAPAPAVREVDEGVAIDYFLPTRPKQLALDILGPDGALIQSFAGNPVDPKKDYKKKDEDDNDPFKPKPKPTTTMKPGLNRFVWKMRHPGFVDFPGLIMWTSSNGGITAIPGRYQARLTVDGKSFTQPFEIRSDPRLTNVTQADLVARFDFANRVSQRVSEANEAVLLIRGIKEQTAAAAGNPSADAALRTALTGFDAKLSAIEGQLYQVRNRSRQDPLNYPIMLNDKLAGLIGVAESAEARPTDQSEAVFATLSAELDKQLAALEQVIASDMPALNARLGKAGLAEIERKPMVVPVAAPAGE